MILCCLFVAQRKKEKKWDGSECLGGETKAKAVCLSVGTSLMLSDWLEADRDSTPQTTAWECQGLCVCSGKLTWMHLNFQEKRGGLKSNETQQLTDLEWQEQPPPHQTHKQTSR